MKRTVTMVFVVACILVTGCARVKESLWMELFPGDVYRYKVTTTQEITQVMYGQSLEMSQTVTMFYIFQVTAVQDNGNALLEVTIDDIGLKTSGPFGSFDYRSWEQTGEIPNGAQTFSALLDKTMNLELSHNGQVLAISGTEPIVEEMLLIYFAVGGDSLYVDKARSDFQDQFGNEAFREIMESIFIRLPDKPVGQGDAWGSVTTVAHKLPMIVRHTWYVAGIEGGAVHLDVHGIIETNPDGTLEDMPGTELLYMLHGTQTGDISIDRISGWFLQGRIDHRIDGVAMIRGVVEGKQQTAQWPMHIKETVDIERL